MTAEQSIIDMMHNFARPRAITYLDKIAGEIKRHLASQVFHFSVSDAVDRGEGRRGLTLADRNGRKYLVTIQEVGGHE